MDEIERKLLAGEELSKSELESLATDTEAYRETEREVHKYWQFVDSIFRFNGRFFKLEWCRTLSDLGEDNFPSQPYEVLPKETKIIKYVRKT